MGRYDKIIENPALPFGPLTNRDLFSNHWLEKRLFLEPEWDDVREDARRALERILEIWGREKDRVKKYEKENPLEEKFIQPVMRELGWVLQTQPTLVGGTPDYALFLSERELTLALEAGRDTPDYWKFPVVVADAKAWHIGLDRPVGKGGQREFPPEQIERYLLRSGLDYGILTISFWQRRVVERCLYGVDLNPMAVELAKLALWLETIAEGQPLTFLDHHLKCGNSLVGADIDDLEGLPHAMDLCQNAVSQQIGKKLPELLAPLKEIQSVQSDSTEQVKLKKDLYKKVEQAREGFLAVADLWCTSFFVDGKPSERQYQKAIGNIGRPRKLKEMVAEGWFQRLRQKTSDEAGRFFHWAFEFPWVFLEENPTRRPGFDAIIGNPPYDVLAEKELGYSLEGYKKFISALLVYGPSMKGKNNLFKLFICRSVQLLADEGRLGFIVPMPLLGDLQTQLVRRLLLDTGAFCSIEAFPQKDDPRIRVFPEAKLSTVLFTFHKTEDEQARKRTFVSRTHPENVIANTSQTLELSTSEIPLYDESNLTIVSCGQPDWNLAVRMMASQRWVRLGTVCKQFQGEVNETNENAKGTLGQNRDVGPLVLRGANICLYQVREASQGKAYWIDREKFITGKPAGSKAYHALQRRIGFQRSSPQNNFRRIIAAPLEPNSFCFDTVSYVPESGTEIPLDFVLVLLNSKLADWYFRLGSTNSKVNEYQFGSLQQELVNASDSLGHLPPLSNGGVASPVSMPVKPDNWKLVKACSHQPLALPPIPPGRPLSWLWGTLGSILAGLPEPCSHQLPACPVTSPSTPAPFLLGFWLY